MDLAGNEIGLEVLQETRPKQLFTVFITNVFSFLSIYDKLSWLSSKREEKNDMSSPAYVPPPWSAGAPVASYYAEGQAPQQTNSPSMQDIAGLTLTLPAANVYQVSALVILCVPMSYAEGTNYPGTNFCVTANGVQYGAGGYTYDDQAPPSYGRKPFTLVVQVPLGATPTVVQGQWASVRGATSIIDSFTSITALACGGKQP